MRRLGAALLGALLIGAIAGPVLGAGGDPFTTSWSRIDGDGSLETVRFQGTGDAKSYAYRDDRATTCGGDPYEITGSVDVDGNVAYLDGTGGCVGGVSGPEGGTLVYDPASGTIDDGIGQPWHRGNGAREAFLGVWRATDLDGSAMKLTFRSIDQLARDVSYLDSLASSCDPDAVWIATGTGVIGSTLGQGRFISLDMHGGCLGGDDVDYVEVYEYQVFTDTLRGPLGADGSELPYTVEWHRG